MQNRASKRLTRVLTVSLTAALLAVPAAHARTAVDARHAALVNRTAAVELRTDARHAVLLDRAGKPNRFESLVGSSESKVVQMHRHLTKLPVATVETGSIESSGGFDWGDAGVGATAGLVLLLLAGGGVLVTRRKLVGV
jgi:hypothetical protein